MSKRKHSVNRLPTAIHPPLQPVSTASALCPNKAARPDGDLDEPVAPLSLAKQHRKAGTQELPNQEQGYWDALLAEVWIPDFENFNWQHIPEEEKQSHDGSRGV